MEKDIKTRGSSIFKEDWVHCEGIDMPLSPRRRSECDNDCLPPIKKWEDRPILFRECPIVHFGKEGEKKSENEEGRNCISAKGIPYEFETSLFKGSVMLRLHDLPQAAEYFRGKKRLSSVVINGQFKKDLSFSKVITGQEFSHPVSQPPSYIVSAVLAFFRYLSPLLRVYIGPQSYLLSPFAHSVQCINVSTEPTPLHSAIIVEENFGEFVLGKKMTNIERKKYLLANKNAMKELSFSPSLFYTFDFYNDVLDVGNFELKALGTSFDITKVIGCQPLRILSRIYDETPSSTASSYSPSFSPLSSSPSSPSLPVPSSRFLTPPSPTSPPPPCSSPSCLYLWNFELWHEKGEYEREEDVEISEERRREIEEEEEEGEEEEIKGRKFSLGALF